MSGAAPASERTLRFAIMCPGLTLPAWQAACIRSLIGSGVARPVALVVDADAARRGTAPRDLLRRRQHLLFRLYNRLLVRPRVAPFRPVDVSAELGHLPRLACRVRQSGFSQYFDDADVDRIRALDLDFMLRFGFGIVRGRILSSARYGIWSYHHGDEREFRGSPAGFWELYHDRPTTGVILQRLSARLDNGTILFRGRLRTALGYPTNLARMYRAAIDWPTLCARRIVQGDTAFLSAPPTRSSAPVYRTPTNAEFLGFIGRQAVRFLRRVATHLLYADDWNIGVARAAPTDLLRGELGTIRWAAAEPDGRSLADPMPLDDGGGTVVYAERLDYRRPGEIVSLRWPHGFAAAHARLELRPGCHASYPFVFHHDGRTFMLPETRRSGRLVLWSRHGSGRWHELCTLLEGDTLADPTLIRHGDHWWLFGCDQSDLPDTKLVIFAAPDPTGPWRPHALNPVKLDVCSARPAGPPFMVDGVLYRPAQDDSVSYGGAVSINRIDRLTPDAFAETTIARIEPPPGSPYPDGIHTVAVLDGLVFVDGKRARLRPDLLATKTRDHVARWRATRPPRDYEPAPDPARPLA